jgi:SAM-dependent methyltransferase
MPKLTPGAAAYEKLLADYYDALPGVARRNDAAFYVGLARQAGGPVLELGCGTGRLLAPMAQAGADVTGLELSPRMLRLCRRKVNRLPAPARARLRLVCGNMARFRLGRKFALVLIPGRAFQHLLSPRHERACLRLVRQHLAPGGRLALDVFTTPRRGMRNPEERKEGVLFPQVRLTDGRRLRVSGRVLKFHPRRDYNDYEIILRVRSPRGRVRRLTHVFPLRHFLPGEMQRLLRQCGFRVLRALRHFGRARRQNSSNLILIAAAGAAGKRGQKQNPRTSRGRGLLRGLHA